MLTETDKRLLRVAYEEAKAGFDEGGCPIGSVLARGGEVVSQGRNQRVQGGDPIAHGEMDALRKAGRQKTYRDTVLYTSLSPCMMCSGTIVQFGIPRVVIGDTQNFGGNEDFLRERGVEGCHCRRSRLYRFDAAVYRRKARALGRRYCGVKSGVRRFPTP